jgi:hypothetical protein
VTPGEQNLQHESRNAEVKSVVIIGLDPLIINYSSPDFASFPGLTAEKVIVGITAAEESLKALGYDAQTHNIVLLTLARQRRRLSPKNY